MHTSISAKMQTGTHQYHVYDHATSAPTHNPKAIIKYILPRTIKPTRSASVPGSRHHSTWSKVGGKFPVAAKGYGLASLVQNKTFSTVSLLHSVNGERIIDEERELERITETLSKVIVKYCVLIANNRFKESQIQRLELRLKEMNATMDKMYKTEITSAKLIVRETLEKKAGLEIKVTEATKTTIEHDHLYEQLLARRNTFDQDLFDYERKIAQNNAECIFLQRRIRHFEDESKFYLLKNETLKNKKACLRCELDEELFTQQTLQIELQALQTEKIVKEDAHAVSLDDVRNSINIENFGSIQSGKMFVDQLDDEVQRMRTGYEQKLDAYRADFQRNYELHLYRFQMQKVSSEPSIHQEHVNKLEQYEREKNELVKQISLIRGNISETIDSINSIEKKIQIENNQYQLNSKQNLQQIRDMIRGRELQLEQALRDRALFKTQIGILKEQVERHSRDGPDSCNKRLMEPNCDLNKRLTIGEHNSHSQSQSQSSDPCGTKSMYPPQIKGDNNTKKYQRRSLPPPASVPTDYRSNYELSLQPPLIIGTEESWEEGTLIRFADFNVNQDCDQLYQILNRSPIDEIAVIHILCNRSVDQRVEIRDKYKQLFNQNLGDALERIKDVSLNKLLRTLLLSNEERDCFVIRRIVKAATTDENILMELFFSRSAQHMQKVRNTYAKLFKSTLEQDLIGDRDAAARRIFLALINANRPEQRYIDDYQVMKDAEILNETGATWGKSDSTFISLLCSRSNEQLKKIFSVYQQYARADIEQTIQYHIEGDLARTLMAIVRIIRNRPRFFAYELKKSLKSTATNEDNVNRIIVSRCEVDSAKIKSEFEKITKRTLYDYVQIHTNKNYRQALLELLRHRIELNSAKSKIEAWKRETKVDDADHFKRSGVRWEEPIVVGGFERANKTALVHSVSYQSILEEKPMSINQQTLSYYNVNKNNQSTTNGNSVSGMHATPVTAQQLNRQSSVPMPNMHENGS